MSRILVIQLGRLGDVIQTTPLLRELLHDNPAGSIDVLVFHSLREIVEGIGLRKVYSILARALPLSLQELDRSIEENRKHGGPIPQEAKEAVRKLELPAYDLIINCTYSPLGAFVAQNTRSLSVTGPVITSAGEVLFHHPAQVYLCARGRFRDENWFNLVDLWRASAPHRKSSAPRHVARLHVPVAAALPFEIPAGRIVALNPGSSDAVRRWPPENFAALAEEMFSRGLTPVLVGAPGDREACAEVQFRSSIPIANLCGKTTVPQLAFFLTRASLLVSNDTGAIHVAAAVGCRSLSLFGSTAYFAETAPWAAGHVILQGPLGSDLVQLHPKLVLAAACYCLGLSNEADLRKEAVRRNASAWETFQLDPQADPLGGISYRPLHQRDLSSDQIFTRELRHLFARSFCANGNNSGVENSALRAWRFAGRLSARHSRCGDVEVQRVIAVLETMREAAARCRTLCDRRTQESAAEISVLSASLIAVMEQLKAHSQRHSRVKPAIHFLDWMCRMMDPMDPPSTFHAHELAYRLAACLLRGSDLRTQARLEASLSIPARSSQKVMRA